MSYLTQTHSFMHLRQTKAASVDFNAVNAVRDAAPTKAQFTGIGLGMRPVVKVGPT